MNAETPPPPSPPPPTLTPYTQPKTLETLLVVAAVALVAAGAAKRFTRAPAAVPTPVPEQQPFLQPVGSGNRSLADQTTSARGVVVPPPAPAAGGNQSLAYRNSYALVLGNSHYTAGGWNSLPGVAEDVDAVSQRLARQGFEVTVMRDLTGKQLEDACKSFIHDHGSTPEHQANGLLIYYAGHGCTLTNVYGGDLAYLVGTDAPHPEQQRAEFMTKAYDMSFFRNLSEQIQAKHAIFIFDSCFSGNFFAQQMRSANPDIEEAATRHARLFITAGSKNQTVPDKSIFRESFLAALDGKADVDRNGYITGTELGVYLSGQVAQQTSQRQTPLWGKSENALLSEGDFVFPLDGAAQLAYGTARPKDESRTGVEFKNSLGMDFLRIGGSRVKGEAFTARDTRALDPAIVRRSQEAGDINLQSKIIISYQVHMSRHEVTWDNWRAVMGQRGTDAFPDGGQDEASLDRPVTHVTWPEAREFCRQLTEREHASKKLEETMEYRLPWEAEWELCTLDPHRREAWRSDDMGGPQFWESLTRGQAMNPVGFEAQNRTGFCDMQGNALEWCHDWFVPGLPQDEMHNPRGSFHGQWRVVRGRSRTLISQDSSGRPQQTIVAVRYGGFAEETALANLGFRIVKAPKDATLATLGTDASAVGYVDKFPGQFFEKSEYAKDRANNEAEHAKLQSAILKLARERLASVGYVAPAITAVDPTNRVTRGFRESLQNFQWVNHLPTTDTLNDETLSKLVLASISAADVNALLEKEKAGSTAKPVRTGGGGGGEPEWIRNTGIKYWLPFAVGGARGFGF